MPSGESRRRPGSPRPRRGSSPGPGPPSGSRSASNGSSVGIRSSAHRGGGGVEDQRHATAGPGHQPRPAAVPSGTARPRPRRRRGPGRRVTCARADVDGEQPLPHDVAPHRRSRRGTASAGRPASRSAPSPRPCPPPAAAGRSTGRRRSRGRPPGCPGRRPSLARTRPVTATVPSGSRCGAPDVGHPRHRHRPGDPESAVRRRPDGHHLVARRSRSRGLSTTTAPPSGVATAETARAKTPGVAAVRSTAARSEVSGPALGRPAGRRPLVRGQVGGRVRGATRQRLTVRGLRRARAGASRTRGSRPSSSGRRPRPRRLRGAAVRVIAEV